MATETEKIPGQEGEATLIVVQALEDFENHVIRQRNSAAKDPLKVNTRDSLVILGLGGHRFLQRLRAQGVISPEREKLSVFYTPCQIAVIKLIDFFRGQGFALEEITAAVKPVLEETPYEETIRQPLKGDGRPSVRRDFSPNDQWVNDWGGQLSEFFDVRGLQMASLKEKFEDSQLQLPQREQVEEWERLLKAELSDRFNEQFDSTVAQALRFEGFTPHSMEYIVDSVLRGRESIRQIFEKEGRSGNFGVIRALTLGEFWVFLKAYLKIISYPIP